MQVDRSKWPTDKTRAVLGLKFKSAISSFLGKTNAANSFKTQNVMHPEWDVDATR